MGRRAVIAGAGMGGLATALACARAGCEVRLFDQANELSEAGAGLQLGPNATRRLREWGLAEELRYVGCYPSQLRVRSATDGGVLAAMSLDALEGRYGAPYATVHRADLQQLLVRAVRSHGVNIRLGARIDDAPADCDVLVGADGLWSLVRRLVVADGLPRATGDVAYRALVQQADLPMSVRSHDVTVWLGPRLHVVTYPVRSGDALNIVAVTEGSLEGRPDDWDQPGPAADLRRERGAVGPALQALLDAVPQWRAWVLHARPPVRSAQELARGAVALVGDAAHPMRPYFAQGAAMALEDASELANCLASVGGVGEALQRYADARWERVARVQALSQRNGAIFHATGVMRWGRDVSLRVLGERLLDQPWLYAG